jgi:hypothetical protein
MANPYTNGGPTTLAAPAPPNVNVTDIHAEEDNYAAQWTFKGLTQNVKRALRIQYTFDKKDAQGNSLGYKVTEYLLVGFAGSNGG